MAKHIQYLSEQCSQHLSEWKHSGQSQADYCRQQDINYATFNKWLCRSRGTTSARKSKTAKLQKNFIPIHVIEPTCVAAHLVTKMEIEFPDGTKLRIN